MLQNSRCFRYFQSFYSSRKKLGGSTRTTRTSESSKIILTDRVTVIAWNITKSSGTIEKVFLVFRKSIYDHVSTAPVRTVVVHCNKMHTIDSEKFAAEYR